MQGAKTLAVRYSAACTAAGAGSASNTGWGVSCCCSRTRSRSGGIGRGTSCWYDRGKAWLGAQQYIHLGTGVCTAAKNSLGQSRLRGISTTVKE